MTSSSGKSDATTVLNPTGATKKILQSRAVVNGFPYIENSRNKYTFYATGKTYYIKSNISCSSFNIFYMIQCNLCGKQYIGETNRRLKDLFHEQRRPILSTNGSSIHRAVSEHFLSSNHSHKDMLLIPLELLKSKRDSVRKAHEAHLIQKAKTVETFWYKQT